ncbi:MAG: hypothetical protein K2I14_00975, partial [Eubacterium sp.]|nr:hypothetical protein [Eubacterium sp.]
MKIIDTYSNIFKSYENNVFNKVLWDNYAISAFGGLNEKIEKDFSRLTDYKDKIYKILTDVPRKIKSAEIAHQSFINATKNLSD